MFKNSTTIIITFTLILVGKPPGFKNCLAHMLDGRREDGFRDRNLESLKEYRMKNSTRKSVWQTTSIFIKWQILSCFERKKKFCGLKTVCVRFRNVCMIPFSSSWCVQAIKRPLRNSQPEKSKELFRCNNNRKKYAFCVEIYLYIYHIGPPVFFKLLKPELALIE